MAFEQQDIQFRTPIARSMGSRVKASQHTPGPQTAWRSPVDDTSVRAGDPFDYAASRRQDDAHNKDRECFYCLSGWVFLGSLATMAKRFSTPFAAAGATVRDGYAFSKLQPIRGVE